MKNTDQTEREAIPRDRTAPGRRRGGRGPIVVLGLDACDPDFFGRMCSEGRAPFLASLAERGVQIRLDSTYGLFSDSPWPSLTAGVSPAKHAFYNYIQMVEGTRDLVRVDARHCRYLPFWSLLADTGSKVATLDVPKTFPVPGVDGSQICAWGEHYPLLRRPASLPAERVEEVIARFGEFPHPDEIVRAGRDEEREILETLRANNERTWRAAEWLWDQDDWDLFFSVASEVHYAGHQFFHLWDPEHWAHEPDAPVELREALPDLLTRSDAAIASFFEHVPADATWFIVSVHGMKANYSANHVMEDLLARLGFSAVRSRPRPTNRVGQVLRWTRGARDLVPSSVREFVNDRLVPDSVHDRAVSSSFSGGLDWSRTRVFFIYSDHFQAFLNANLAGREPGGIVSPGREMDALHRELRTELRRVVNADTGRPAVRDVVRVADVYEGPNLHVLPDFVVQWAEEAPLERIHHPAFGEMSAGDFELRKSQHASDGWLIAGGRHMDGSATLDRATTLDLAPTILHLLGEALPSDLDGRVLVEALDPTFRDEHRPVWSDDPAVRARMRNPMFRGGRGDIRETPAHGVEAPS